MPNRRRWAIGILLAALAGLLIVWQAAPVVRSLAGHRRVSRQIQFLRLGMTSTEVSRAMDRAPDCTVAVGRAAVWYYAADPADVRVHSVCQTGQGRVARWEDVPVVYAAAEVAFDAEGHTAAFGFCGEGLARAVRGASASCMRFLEPSARPK
jgi:hypothetical protein